MLHATLAYMNAAEHGAMRRAIFLARHARRTFPNPAVGAVLLHKGRVVGEGWHRMAGGAHAEVVALEDAARRGKKADTAVVTLEPCGHHGRRGPCAEALLRAGIARVIFAVPDAQHGGAEHLRRHGCEVICASQYAGKVRALSPGFFSWAERGRAFVRIKMALCAQGTMGTAGQRTPLSGGAAWRFVHELRAQAAALVVGAQTAEIDRPHLGARLLGRGFSSPKALVLDPQRRAHMQPHFWRVAASALPADQPKNQQMSKQNSREILARSLRELAEQPHTESLLIEGGAATIARAFVEDSHGDLVDEVVVIQTSRRIAGPRVLAPRIPGRFRVVQSFLAGVDRVIIYRKEHA